MSFDAASGLFASKTTARMSGAAMSRDIAPASNVQVRRFCFRCGREVVGFVVSPNVPGVPCCSVACARGETLYWPHGDES